MGIWDAIQDSAMASRRVDEELHALALREVQSGVRRDGLWAKALIDASGNEAVAHAHYLRLLVRRLRDDWYLHQKSQTQVLAGQSTRPEVKLPQARDSAAARHQRDAERQTQELYAYRSKLLSACADVERSNKIHVDTYQFLACAINARLKVEGLIFKTYKLCGIGETHTFRVSSDLRRWFIENVIPHAKRIGLGHSTKALGQR